MRELKQELEPKEDQIETLNQQLQEQDGELVEELKRASVSIPVPWPCIPCSAVKYSCAEMCGMGISFGVSGDTDR